MTTTQIDLSGQVALVTGASRGLGRAIAETLARAGADLLVNYSKTPCDDLVAFATQLGRRAVAVQADVAKTEDCTRLVETAIAEFGRLDILVNNAGITRDGLLMRMDDAAWNDVLDTNLRSVFAMCRAACKPMMKARSGSIINISSIAGIMGNPGQANYSASKAGVIGFTKSVARELASRGIRANVVAPGFITSDMTNVLPEKIRDAVIANIPAGRFGEAQDIANAALFLASPLSSYVTGHVLTVDGGMAM